MLWTIVAVLVALWLVGMLTNFTLGGLLHLLLVIAAVVAIVRLLQGKSPLPSR